jgi:hypothetical protein
MPGFPLARGSVWAGGRDHTPSRVPQRWGTTSCRDTAPLTPHAQPGTSAVGYHQLSRGSSTSLLLAVVVLFVQVAVAVGTLGPTFIKFGQALASRPDLVGAAFADALTVLQVYSDDAKEIAGFREQQRERNSYSLRG